MRRANSSKGRVLRTLKLSLTRMVTVMMISLSYSHYLTNGYFVQPSMGFTVTKVNGANTKY